HVPLRRTAAGPLRLDRRTAGLRHCRIDEPHDHGCSGTQARHHDGPMALQSLQESLHELYPAVAYGADGVEHIRGTSRRGYSPKISGLSRSYRDVIDLLTSSKMTLTPTIGIQGGFRLQTLRDPSWIDDPRIQRLYPPAVWQRWRDQTRTPPSAPTLQDGARLVTPQEHTVFQIVKGGGRVTAGTDAPINPYGLSLLMELENYA